MDSRSEIHIKYVLRLQRTKKRFSPSIFSLSLAQYDTIYYKMRTAYAMLMFPEIYQQNLRKRNRIRERNGIFEIMVSKQENRVAEL